MAYDLAYANNADLSRYRREGGGAFDWGSDQAIYLNIQHFVMNRGRRGENIFSDRKASAANCSEVVINALSLRKTVSF